MDQPHDCPNGWEAPRQSRQAHDEFRDFCRRNGSPRVFGAAFLLGLTFAASHIVQANVVTPDQQAVIAKIARPSGNPSVKFAGKSTDPFARKLSCHFGKVSRSSSCAGDLCFVTMGASNGLARRRRPMSELCSCGRATHY